MERSLPRLRNHSSLSSMGPDLDPCSQFTCCWSLTWRILSITLLVCAAAAAKSLQSCPTLCDPIDSSPPGYPVPGILQARTLQWVAISFSNAWKWKVKVKSLSLWDEYNWAVVWALFGIAFLWDWSENWPFPVLWPLQRKLHWTLVMSCACVLSCVRFFVTL